MWWSRYSSLLSYLLLSSVWLQVLICSRQVSSESPESRESWEPWESCRRFVRQRWREGERDRERERERCHLWDESRGRTGGWRAGQIMVWDKHHILFKHTKQRHTLTSSSNLPDLIRLKKYILKYFLNIVNIYLSPMWSWLTTPWEMRLIPAGWKCPYISLPGRAGSSSQPARERERERCYLALLSLLLPPPLTSSYPHRPCRCVYACSDLLCQGKERRHLLFLKLAMMAMSDIINQFPIDHITAVKIVRANQLNIEISW